MLGIEHPIICGAMYPCSNPELVAAVSDAGAIGIIQPLSMEYVHKKPLLEGIQYIRTLTHKPIGMNALIESSSKMYKQRMEKWIDIALEQGIKFFITSLGNPKWVVKMVAPSGGIVFHDVVNRKHATKAIDAGVQGLIAVNSRAGGHAGPTDPQKLFEELKDLGLPLICAGGVGGPKSFRSALEMGYQGVQMGTRFIATKECTAHNDYKKAILEAQEKDIVLTERVTGVPLAVITTPHLQKTGTKAGPIARLMLKGRKTKHWIRTYYSLMSFIKLKNSLFREVTPKDLLQAGKSVDEINEIVPAKKVVQNLVEGEMSDRSKLA